MSNHKKRLVILSAFYEPYMSGAEQMTKEIVERLGNDYETYLITGKYDRNLPRLEDRGSFVLVRVGLGCKRLDKFFYPLLAAFFARGIRPDITHAIMESYAGGALALLRLIYPKTKRVLTLQCGDLDDPGKQKKWYIRQFWKIIHTWPHKTTAISTFLADRARRLGARGVEITPNGIDFSEVPAEARKEENRVVMVGRLSWEKAHVFLLNAWPEVLGEFAAAKLVLIGEGPERKSIERVIKDLKISDSVTMTGNLPHKAVLDEVKRSQVFICPSLAEGLGNVFIEAQACGVPPIGTRVGGIPDVIRHEENGLLIEPKNSKQIAEAIIRLLSDDVLRERLGKRAEETSRDFEWERVIRKINRIYLDIIKA